MCPIMLSFTNFNEKKNKTIEEVKKNKPLEKQLIIRACLVQMMAKIIDG